MSLKLFLRRGESSPRIPPEHPFLRFYRRNMVENMLKFSVLQEEKCGTLSDSRDSQQSIAVLSG